VGLEQGTPKQNLSQPDGMDLSMYLAKCVARRIDSVASQGTRRANTTRMLSKSGHVVRKNEKMQPNLQVLSCQEIRPVANPESHYMI